MNQVKFYQGVEIRTQESGGQASGMLRLEQEEGTQWIDGNGCSVVSCGNLSPEVCDELFPLIEFPIIPANNVLKHWGMDKGKECFLVWWSSFSATVTFILFWIMTNSEDYLFCHKSVTCAYM